jgi:hypothetical protein
VTPLAKILTVMIPAIVAIGCAADGSSPSAPTGLVPEGALVSQASRVPVYGLARPRADLRGCRARTYRGFDFWLGRWDVVDPATPDAVVGTDEVTRELGGCALEERWTDAQGGRGRSLNTYDAGTRQWNQLWMDHSGGALILSGPEREGIVTMAGDTPQFIGGPIITNRLTWSRGAGSNVTQVWEVSDDAWQTWTTVFTGDYRRRDRIQPAPEVLNPFCGSPTRLRFHWFDFLIGEWDVRRDDAAGERLGALVVKKDVSDCLIEAVFEAPGYRGKAFAAFHSPSLTWHRTWIDQDGVRIALAGVLVNGSMVMTGRRALAGGGGQDLRATWTPTAPSQVEERWEISTDGGASWLLDRRFILTSR